jgi:hypothetical protein
MNRMIQSTGPTLGTAVILCAFAGALLGDTLVTPNSQESDGAEHRKRRHKGGSDVVRGHGFIRDKGDFTTIDAPRAGLYTVPSA